MRIRRRLERDGLDVEALERTLSPINRFTQISKAVGILNSI